jgi:Protein of unknown function (DUF2012)
MQLRKCQILLVGRCAAMRSVALLAACSALATFVAIQKAAACFQMDSPSVSIRSTSVTGTVTLNGKPIAGAVLSLHKFLGPYSIEMAHADTHPIAKTVGGKDGSFSFGEVPMGKYMIAMASPSYEFTKVELVRPKSSKRDTVSIQFFADYCQSATAVSSTGERLRHSSPPIAGMSGSRF